MYLIFLETTIVGLHVAADNIGLSSLKFYGELRKFCLFLQEWRFSRSRSSKVIDFGTNRKHVCDFLLVCHSNLGPILHRFGDCSFYVLLTPPLFRPNFWAFWGCSRKHPVASDRPHISYSAVKLFSKYYNLCVITVPVPKRYRQTDRQLRPTVASPRSAEHRVVKNMPPMQFWLCIPSFEILPSAFGVGQYFKLRGNNFQ